MKKIIYLFLLILLIPFIHAQPYPTAQQLTIAMNLTTGFTITQANQDSEVQASISYLPGEDIIKALTPFAIPEAAITQTPEKIHYTWKKAAPGTYTFGYNAVLTTTATAPQLQATVYPANKLPPETLTYTEATPTIDITRA